MVCNMIHYMLKNLKYLKSQMKLNIKLRDMVTGMHLEVQSLLHLGQLNFLVNLIMHCMLLNHLTYLNGGLEYYQLTGAKEPCATQCGVQSLHKIESTFIEKELG